MNFFLSQAVRSAAAIKEKPRGISMARYTLADRFKGSDMTPLIDLMFQLLMFFVIVSHFEVTKANERMKLPSDTLAKPPEVSPKAELLLHVGFPRDPNGLPVLQEPMVLFGGREIPVGEIREPLETEKRRLQIQEPETLLNDVTILVRADIEVPTGLIQRLIKTCREVGFTKFSLKTTQDETR